VAHAATLAAKARLHYASLYDYHLRPYLGSIALREITPEVIGRWQSDRLASGAGPIAVRHAMDLLGSILEYAFVGGHLSANPARRVKKGEVALAGGGAAAFARHDRGDARSAGHARRDAHLRPSVCGRSSW
jgi:hypothetical protein